MAPTKPPGPSIPWDARGSVTARSGSGLSPAALAPAATPLQGPVKEKLLPGQPNREGSRLRVLHLAADLSTEEEWGLAGCVPQQGTPQPG